MLLVLLVQQTLSPIRSGGADRQRRPRCRAIKLVDTVMRSDGRDMRRRNGAEDGKKNTDKAATTKSSDVTNHTQASNFSAI
jgi:hypothetical protein